MLNRLRSLKGRFRYDDSEMPFLEHLEEFRKMVIRCLIALTVGLMICLPFADQLVAILRAPAEPYIERNAEETLADASLRLKIQPDAFSAESLVKGEQSEYYDIEADIAVPERRNEKRGTIRLQFSEPAAAIKMWLSVAFFGGILLSLPALVFFIGMFVMPGIRDIERKVMTRIAFFSSGLFLLGVLMGYRVTLPLALGLMLKIGGQLGGESIWFYNKYIAFALQLLLGFGLAFQLPVVILVLGKMGLVSSRQLRDKRRHVFVGLLVLAMILTPPDVMTQLLMAAPLILLYEFCIWFLHFSGNREKTAAQEEGKPEPGAENSEPEVKKDSNEE